MAWILNICLHTFTIPKTDLSGIQIVTVFWQIKLRPLLSFLFFYSRLRLWTRETWNAPSTGTELYRKEPGLEPILSRSGNPEWPQNPSRNKEWNPTPPWIPAAKVTHSNEVCIAVVQAGMEFARLKCCVQTRLTEDFQQRADQARAREPTRVNFDDYNSLNVNRQWEVQEPLLWVIWSSHPLQMTYPHPLNLRDGFRVHPHPLPNHNQHVYFR